MTLAEDDMETDNSHFDMAHEAMLELEQRTVIALQHVVAAGVPEDDVRLLCYHSGIRYEHVKGTQ